MSRGKLAFIYFATFLTGSAGLIYQVAWQRYLSRIVGADTMATAVILAVFLGGLSLGYYLCGKLTVNTKNQFKVYARLEIVIAIWGVSFVFIYSFVDGVTQFWSFDPPFWMLIQGILVATLLMGLPTLCMGGTVPMLTKGLTVSLSDATKIHAQIYALNTFGAFVGSIIAGFFLIEYLGLKGSLLFAALLNGIAGVGFWLIFRDDPVSSSRGASVITRKNSIPEISQAPSLFKPTHLYVIVFLNGFYVMSLENVFIRITNLTLGTSSYSFSLIISVFILSIALGSAWIGKKKSIRPSLLFFNQLSITLLLLLVFVTLDKWPYVGHLLRVSFQNNMPGFWLYNLAIFLALTLVLLAPVALMGATVPIAFHELKKNLSTVGLHAGRLLAFNGIGALLGSLLGGMVVFYFLELDRAFLLSVLLAGVSCWVASLPLKRYFSLMAAGGILLVTVFITTSPFFNSNRFAVGTFLLSKMTGKSLNGPEAFYKNFLGNSEHIFLETGPTNTVAIVDFKDKKGQLFVRSIYSNGRSESGIGGDVRRDTTTMVLSAQIPALFAHSREDVLVIGMGTGVTAGEFLHYKDTKKITVAEISETIIKALPFFSDFNNNLDKSDHYELWQGDALRTLRRSEKRWDIVVSEPSNPFVTGVDQLFNREFYELVRKKLKNNGLLLQWVQGYATTPRIFSMVFNTMNTVFENIYIFEAGPFDYLMLATSKPITNQDIKYANKVIHTNKAVGKSLAKIGIMGINGIMKKMVPALVAMAWNSSEIEEADHPRLHYLAGRAFYLGRNIQKEININSKKPLTSKIIQKYKTGFLSEKPLTLFPRERKRSSSF